MTRDDRRDREHPGNPGDPDDPAEGLRLVESRIAAVAEAIRSSARPIAAGPFEPIGVTATGLGSSRAHARLLVHLLAAAGVDARFAPTGALAASPPDDAVERMLVVFSQGLSPNGCAPFAFARAWRRALVVTATADRADARGDRLRALLALGVEPLRFAGENEFGTLFRIVGPMAGYAIAYPLARAIATRFGREARIAELDAERVVAAIARARERAPRLAPSELDRGVALVASGGYGELADNLRLKLLEGILVPEPPVWDLLEFAHGPFQQIHDRETTLLALTRRDARGERTLLARLRAMLVAERHRVVELAAELPGPLALFEHEAILNEIVLADLRARGRDPRRWSGQGEAGPLYDVERIPGGDDA